MYNNETPNGKFIFHFVSLYLYVYALIIQSEPLRERG